MLDEVQRQPCSATELLLVASELNASLTCFVISPERWVCSCEQFVSRRALWLSIFSMQV